MGVYTPRRTPITRTTQLGDPNPQQCESIDVSEKNPLVKSTILKALSLNDTVAASSATSPYSLQPSIYGNAQLLIRGDST
jgi:hypothetical protein